MKVALESTLITHGLPSPTNVEVALKLEEVVRSGGCVPQTVAVLAGVAKVGLSLDEIRLLARRENVFKAGVRDLPVVISQRMWASTTVSATMRLAKGSGIPVFATGGIGGVHKGKWDVSQDILELSRTSMVVVSAGPKAILDLSGTYEMLETFGVTVVGYQTDEMPAFYSRESGIPITRVNSPDEIAAIYHNAGSLGLPGAILVFDPIPPEFEITANEYTTWLDRSLAALEAGGLSGSAVTPFLLDKMAEYSEGKTVACNIELLLNNTTLASQIGRALEGMEQS